MMQFSEKLRALMQARRFSQSELAAELGTNQPQISRWLEADTPPRSDYLLKLARVLGVTADYLIDPEQVAPPRELTADERYLLQLFRDLGVSREAAARALAGAARGEAGEPGKATGEAWRPGGVRDLTAGELARQRDGRRKSKRRASEREADSQDEGTDPDHAPGRVR